MKMKAHLCRKLAAVALSAVALLCAAPEASAQKIYSARYQHQADVKVYVVEHEYQADIVVYRTERQYEAKSNENKGIWYMTEREYNADKKIYFVDYPSQADLKVFFTDKRYRAGWKNPEKRYLLY